MRNFDGELGKDPIYTNHLEKGDRILQFNGWYGNIADNGRGNTRMVTVEGFFTETGSVYSHDIAYYIAPDGLAYPITHTTDQLKLKEKVAQLEEILK